MKLHLGCGKRFIPGFVHIDRDKYAHTDYERDIKDLSIFKDNSAELIYLCHCFNAFDDDDAKIALAEYRRVLKAGGVLRIATPDFASIVQHYVTHKDIDPLRRLVTGYYKGKDEVMYHRAVHDEASLSRLLLSSGFDHVRRYDWRETSYADVDDYAQAYLPHMDKENGMLMSLNIEAW
jgi:predicted SAM-dependent methyltransferase